MELSSFFRKCSIFQYIFEESVDNVQNFSEWFENDRFKRDSSYPDRFDSFSVHHVRMSQKYRWYMKRFQFFRKCSILQYVFEESV